MRFGVIIRDFSFDVEITYKGSRRTMDHPGDDPDWQILDIERLDDAEWSERQENIEEAFIRALVALNIDVDQLHAAILEKYAEELQYQQHLDTY